MAIPIESSDVHEVDPGCECKCATFVRHFSEKQTLGVSSMPAEKMSARGRRALATTDISLSTVSLPKGIQFSQMRDASVFVASPIDTCCARKQRTIIEYMNIILLLLLLHA